MSQTEVHPMPSTTTNARPTLAAAPREILGKHVARLRRDGQLPAVVYGHGVPSSSVTINAHDFELLRRKTGPNALVDLSVDGKKADPVLIHDVQVHPVTHRPLHVDLFLVRLTEELTVDVPLTPIGISPAIENDGGTLLHAIESVRIKALPDHLPSSIEYSIESLVDFDTAVHVRDLAIPPDVTLLTDPDEIVAKVQAPRVEVEEPVAVAEGEGEAEAAEGEEAAEGSAEGGSEGGSSEG
jgi:large subunit ribosomal protein L25